MAIKSPFDLAGMNRAFFETLDADARVDLLCRLHSSTVELSERLGQTSANSSRPPSSDGPFAGSPGGLPGLGGLGPMSAMKGPTPRAPGSSPAVAPAEPKRKPGKQPGAKGMWRSQALIPENTENHVPDRCAACGGALEAWFPHTGYRGLPT